MFYCTMFHAKLFVCSLVYLIIFFQIKETKQKLTGPNSLHLPPTLGPLRVCNLVLYFSFKYAIVFFCCMLYKGKKLQRRDCKEQTNPLQLSV